MRDITKSVVSFSWSMSLLGLQQLGGARARDCGRSAESLDTVARAMEDQLGGVLKDTFKTGDKFQRGLVDMMFGMLGRSAARPGGWGPKGTEESPWQDEYDSCGAGDRPGPGWPAESSGWGPAPHDPDAGDRSSPDDFTTEGRR